MQKIVQIIYIEDLSQSKHPCGATIKIEKRSVTSTAETLVCSFSAIKPSNVTTLLNSVSISLFSCF